MLKSLIAKPAEIANVFATSAYQIDGVKKVYYKQTEENIVYIWTVVKKDDLSLRSKVYEVESALYEQFPKTRFDFYVITLERSQRKDIKEIIPRGFSLITKE